MHHASILFDLDGTLTDPREGITRSVQYALAKLGIIEPELAALEHFIGPPLLQCFMASYALDEWKGIMLLVNKWDLVEKDSYTMFEFTRQIRAELKFIDYVPMLFISALTRQRVQKVIPLAQQIEAERRKRVPTSALNKLVQDAAVKHRAPSKTGKQLRFYFRANGPVHQPELHLQRMTPRERAVLGREYLARGLLQPQRTELLAIGLGIETIAAGRRQSSLREPRQIGGLGAEPPRIGGFRGLKGKYERCHEFHRLRLAHGAIAR